MQRFRLVAFAAGTGLALLFAMEAAHAQVPLRIEVTIKDHRFSPAEVHVPARTRAIIKLHNADPVAEESDFAALDIEKVIAGRRSGVVRLRPLEPGRYPFMSEFHADTAQGVIIVE